MCRVFTPVNTPYCAASGPNSHDDPSSEVFPARPIPLMVTSTCRAPLRTPASVLAVAKPPNHCGNAWRNNIFAPGVSSAEISDKKNVPSGEAVPTVSGMFSVVAPASQQPDVNPKFCPNVRHLQAKTHIRLDSRIGAVRHNRTICLLWTTCPRVIISLHCANITCKETRIRGFCCMANRPPAICQYHPVARAKPAITGMVICSPGRITNFNSNTAYSFVVIRRSSRKATLITSTSQHR